LRAIPSKKEVWTFAKASPKRSNACTPTSSRRVPHRKTPRGRVLVDYNQNAPKQTLASVYFGASKPRATVSTPVTWEEVEAGVDMKRFSLDNVRERYSQVGDLWAPMKAKRGRFDLSSLLEPVRARLLAAGRALGCPLRKILVKTGTRDTIRQAVRTLATKAAFALDKLHRVKTSWRPSIMPDQSLETSLSEQITKLSRTASRVGPVSTFLT